MLRIGPIEANEGRKLLCCSSGHASPPIGHERIGQGHVILRWAKALEGAGEAAGPAYSLINARPRRMRSCLEKHRVLRDRHSSSACACPALPASYRPGVSRILRLPGTPGL